MASILHIDFETRSTCDLRKAGIHVYAADPTTDILCMGWAFDDENINLWTPSLPLPMTIRKHIENGGEVWAHNFQFERLIWNNVGVNKYGWPKLNPAQGVCTMVMAYAMGLPGSLDGCAAALGISEQKDLAGSRLMVQMCKPRAVDPKTGAVSWWDDVDRLSRLYLYCVQDVKVERMVGKKMPKLSPYEKRVWLLDQKINDLGIMVDVPAVRKAVELVENEKFRLNKEIQRESDNAIAACTAVQQIKDYLEFFGVSGESLDKAAVGEWLADPSLDPKARRILELRNEAGKSSTAKFAPMAESAGKDGRLRGCFQYSGANTRRFTGRRIQLQNLKRASLKFETIEQIIESMKGGATAEELNLCYGSPLSILGDCTRSFLIAPPGKILGVADFNAIEARVLAWLAGQENVLEVFRSGQDIYKEAAGQIFGCKASEVDSDQRQVGKVAILALGYGGGVGAFQTMAKGYGVKMEPAFHHLEMVATQEQRIKALEMWKLNKAKYPEISEKEFVASELTKVFWRENNPAIEQYWYDLENAAVNAVNAPNKAFEIRNVTFKKVGSFLWCRLPGGGVICYPYPEIKEVTTPWGAKKQAFTYMAEDGMTHKWQRFSTYGGSLAENITQSVARDLLVDAMLRLDEKGFSIAAHVHDEIICEMPEKEADLPSMISIMTQNPAWSKGLPLKAAGFVSKRYRK